VKAIKHRKTITTQQNKICHMRKCLKHTKSYESTLIVYWIVNTGKMGWKILILEQLAFGFTQLAFVQIALLSSTSVIL
jgi:hypothetical protein